MSSMLPCIYCIAGRSGTDKEFAASDILEALEEYFLETVLGQSLLHWVGRLFAIENHLG